MPLPNSVRKDSPLRTERLQRHWSQRQLAEQLGATVATVKRWERQVTTPSPYFRLKLTALFGKSEDELGLFNEETKSVSASHEVPAQWEILLAAPDPVVNEIPQPETSTSKTDTLFIHANLNTRKNYFHSKQILCFLLIILFVCVALLIYWPSHAFSPYSISSMLSADATSTNSSATPGQVLYQAQWAQGLNNWSVSEHCTWSGNMGGEIITDGGNANDILLAPYTLRQTDYALEVSIQRIAYTHLGGDAYGLVVRNSFQAGGYIAGVGVHFLPEHFFLGLMTRSGDNGSEYVSSDLARASAHLDTQWHTYRIEVRKSSLRFLIDGIVVAQNESSLHTQPGNVGIYIDSARIAIRNFKLFSL